MAAYVMRKRGARIAYVWLLLLAIGFGVLLILLLIPSSRINPLVYQNWFRSGNYQLSLNFRINESNWPVITALIAMHTALLLTATAKQNFRQDSFYWIVETGLAALSFMVLAAADLWTVVLTWTAMDLATILYRIFVRRITDFDSLFRSYFFKLSGSLLLALNAAQLAGRGQSLLLENLSLTNSASLLFTAILHSGVLPLTSPRKAALDIETFLDYLAYFLPLISSLYLVVYLPESNLPLFMNFGLRIFFLIIIFYFIYRWLNSEDELEGAYLLLYSFTGYVAYRFLVGLNSGLGGWFVIMLIMVTWLRFYSHRGRSTIFFPILILIAMSGLPFTLISYGNGGVIVSSIRLSSILLILFHIMFFSGYCRFLFQHKEKFDEMESSFQITYLAGLFLPILATTVITFRLLGSLLDELSFGWVGLVVLVLSIGLYYWLNKREMNRDPEDLRQQSAFKRLQVFLSFNWLFNIINYFINRIKPLVTGFSSLLEGEGAILWSIVFLALLITLLRTG